MKTKIKELNDPRDSKPIGLPRVVAAEEDWRSCNYTGYQKFLEKVKQVMPEEADGFVKGEWINIGRYMDRLVSYVPIQFYKKN